MSQKCGTPTYSRGGQNRGEEWRERRGKGRREEESRVEKNTQRNNGEDLLKNINLHMQEAKQTPSRINTEIHK